MKLFLKDREKNPLWFIPGTHISFTYENPGPIEIDPSKLSELQKKQIQAAVFKNVLSVEGDMSLLSVVKKDAVVAKSYSSIQEAPVRSPQEDRLEKLKDFINGGTIAIRDNLTKYSVSDLRLMLSLEEAGKNRKTVKDYIAQHLAKHQKQVTESVSKEADKPAVLTEPVSGLTPEQLMGISEVTDEEQETISINTGE